MKKRILSFTIVFLLLGTAASAVTPTTLNAGSDCTVSYNGNSYYFGMPNGSCNTIFGSSNMMDILNSFDASAYPRCNAADAVSSDVSDAANAADIPGATGTAAPSPESKAAQKQAAASETHDVVSGEPAPVSSSTPAAAPDESCAPTNARTGNTSDHSFYTRLRQLLTSCSFNKALITFLCPTTSPDVSQTPEAPEASKAPQPSAVPEIPENTTAPDTTEPSGKADSLTMEQQVAALVNEQRAANGLAPLTLNAELSNVARAKSRDMHDNNYFAHTSPTYGSPFDMLDTFGISYRSAGENIAMGYATAEQVMSGWMNSAGHRANILNPSYTQIGIGYVADGSYWTQEFIG